MPCLPTRLVVALLLCLFCIRGWALTGPETAQQLNQRLAATPAQCVGGQPVEACSGVLVLPMAKKHPKPFWHHGAEAVERGSEAFRYLRRDLGGEPLADTVGYILHDGFTAQSQGKGYEVVDDGNALPGQRLVRNWDEQAPEQLAVQALYYDASQVDSLLRAQQGQLDFFEATGQWLPLVRFDPDGGASTFGFSTQEQLYNGYQVAARLNARFVDTAMGCRDGRSAYYCNGVILRTVGPGDFHAWNPSPNAIRIGGVSFSYFRRDLEADTMLYPRGYVIRELSAPAQTPFEPMCFFPMDGDTGEAPKGKVCTRRNTCQALGVDTVAKWLDRYQSKPRESCSLSLSQADLQLAHDIRQQAPNVDPWTELVIRTWPQDIGQELSIEAVAYSTRSHHGGAGLTGARHTQRDYLEQTGRYLPMLKADFRNAAGQPFSFDPALQSKP